MTHFRETDDKEATVGFRLPQYVVELIDILCKQEDLNRSQFLRRALDAYEPMRDAIGEFEQEMQAIDGISNDS
jgi:Arc/MetJ-type ribon-helix-helix transcriptional regulator